MIRIYFLPVISEEDTNSVSGSNLIHDALLLTTEDPDVRKLIMDTTDEEHTQLVALADSWLPASQEEIEHYNDQVIITPPDPDTIRAEELLAASPDVITQPEIWELLRIFGRRLGFR